MSDYYSNSCNRCTYERMKHKYEKEGKEVSLKASKKIPGWMAVCVDGKERAWLMEVPQNCAC